MRSIKKILCVGAALSDILINESDSFLEALRKEKGGMTLVEAEDIEHALKHSGKVAEFVPGGSACNTAVALGQFGVSVRFMGKIGDDEVGEDLKNQLEKWGVKCHLPVSKTPTGRVLSIITPDAQRTMMTYLGASAELSPDELDDALFKKADLVHVEGYLLFNEAFFDAVLQKAQSNDCKVSIDLSSFEVVRMFHDKLTRVLPESIDLVIANEDEAKAYTGKNPSDSLEVFSGLCEMSVVKLGAGGVLIAHNGTTVHATGQRITAIDTTGAGDLWAGGFLYGLTADKTLAEAANIGNKTGAAVVQVVGAKLPADTYKEIIANN